MIVSVNKEESQWVVSVEGRIDTITAVEFERKCKDLPSVKRPSLMVNMGAVTYISSAGLRIFILLAQKTHQLGGRIGLRDLSNDIKEIFRISGLIHFFDFDDAA